MCNLESFHFPRENEDNIVIISYGNVECHLIKAKIDLKICKPAGFKTNAEKSFFTKDNLEYIGFKITR